MITSPLLPENEKLRKLYQIENEIALDLVNYILTGKNHSCKAYHHYGKCEDRAVLKFKQIFMKVLKINLPIHVIPLLLFRRKQLLTEPVQTLKKFVINILRSVMFLTGFVIISQLIQCYGSRLFPWLPTKQLHMLSFAFSGVAMAFEQPHKRVELNYFTLPKVAECIWNLLCSRKLAGDIPKQEHIVFALSFGLIAMAYDEGKSNVSMKGFTSKICGYLWKKTELQGKDENQENIKSKDSSNEIKNEQDNKNQEQKLA
ncbi:UNKNOWN [Stylonychia lemnae]|uniref:Transmembrane protein 135 N-terminal domain-containing protein n=1 Tax=Stylonychia lemnae TaxID=5949 RepID=A0A078A048_STYLE|nr:UNKNOWN [Stylonychia lemnae]|eukprot:CDW75520.1 UNKNOWN [Stylonychia lemnae]